MSLYKPKKSPFWHYDFRVDGHRFHGSTGATDRRDAKRVEDGEKTRARADLAMHKSAPLTIDLAADRYWVEVGQHHAAPQTTFANLKRLVDYFGAAKRLDEIDGRAVADLIAWRRGHTVKGRKTQRDPENPKARLPAPLIAPATVNRSVLDPLIKIFNRAKRVWGLRFAAEPAWRDLRLREPQEITREVLAHEEGPIEAAVRADYLPLVRFARASGLRLAECLLRKSHVDLAAGVIVKPGKGDRLVRRRITTEMRAILMAEMANPTDYVFTYAAARAKRDAKGRTITARGERRPITISGLKSIWRRSRWKKGARLPADLRFHDLRHDFATTLLRETGNLKLTQLALGHAKIETTTKYAHVLDDEIAAGMEAAAQARKRKRAAALAQSDKKQKAAR